MHRSGSLGWPGRRQTAFLLVPGPDFAYLWLRLSPRRRLSSFVVLRCKNRLQINAHSNRRRLQQSTSPQLARPSIPFIPSEPTAILVITMVHWPKIQAHPLGRFDDEDAGIRTDRGGVGVGEACNHACFVQTLQTPGPADAKSAFLPCNTSNEQENKLAGCHLWGFDTTQAATAGVRQEGAWIGDVPESEDVPLRSRCPAILMFWLRGGHVRRSNGMPFGAHPSGEVHIHWKSTRAVETVGDRVPRYWALAYHGVKRPLCLAAARHGCQGFTTK